MCMCACVCVRLGVCLCVLAYLCVCMHVCYMLWYTKFSTKPYDLFRWRSGISTIKVPDFSGFLIYIYMLVIFNLLSGYYEFYCEMRVDKMSIDHMKVDEVSCCRTRELLSLPTNIRPGCKLWPRTITLFYLRGVPVTRKFL